MKKKQRLTEAEHEALAAELRGMRDRLGEIKVELAEAYPLAIANRAGRAQSVVDKLRDWLDNLYFKENPNAEQSPYYGRKSKAGVKVIGAGAKSSKIVE